MGADYGEGKRTCPEKKRGFNLGFIGTFRRVAKDGEGLQTKPLADGEAFEHEGEARTFGAAERQDHGGLGGVGRGRAIRIERPVRRDRRAGPHRLAQAAIGHDGACEIEQERIAAAPASVLAVAPAPAPARHRDRDRACAEMGAARAVIGHERRSAIHHERSASLLRRPLRVAADRAGMGGLAHQHDAHGIAASGLDRKASRLHHRDRAGRAGAIKHDGARSDGTRPGPRARIELAAVDEIKVGREADDAMAVGAAKIGPDQPFGDRRSVLRTHALGAEDRGDEPVKDRGGECEYRSLSCALRRVAGTAGRVARKA